MVILSTTIFSQLPFKIIMFFAVEVFEQVLFLATPKMYNPYLSEKKVAVKTWTKARE